MFPFHRNNMIHLKYSHLSHIYSLLFGLLYIFLSLQMPSLMYQTMGVHGDVITICGIVACIFLVWLKARFKRGISIRFTLPGVFFLTTIVLYVVIGSINAESSALLESFKYNVIILIPLFLLGFFYVKSEKDARFILMLTVLVAFISASSVFLELIFQDQWINFVGTPRLLSGTAGLFLNRNGTVMAIIPGIIAALFFLQRQKRILGMLILMGIVILCSLATLATVSIAGWTILGLSFLGHGLMWCISRGQRRVTGLIFYFFAVIVLVGVFAAAMGNSGNRSEVLEDIVAYADKGGGRLTGSTSLWEDSTFEYRGDAARYYFERFLESPFVGLGLSRAAIGENNSGVGVHNQFILLASEAGIIPLLTYVVFFVMLLHSLWRRRVHLIARVFFLIVLSIILFNFVSHNIFDSSRQFIIILGVVTGAIHSIPINKCSRTPGLARP
jgi:hypothetical protein